MAIDVEVLILEPFREVVERGKEAAANAEAAQDDDPELSKEMAKAAQAVMKGGERALKRLQPLWDSQVEKYGDDFKETMRENGEPSSALFGAQSDMIIWHEGAADGNETRSPTSDASSATSSTTLTISSTSIHSTRTSLPNYRPRPRHSPSTPWTPSGG